MALQQNFLLRFVRLGLEVGSGLALNLGATYLSTGPTTIPLAVMMVGAAAALLAAKGSADFHLSKDDQAKAENELTSAIQKYGSLPKALEAISNGTECNSGFSPESAQKLLKLLDDVGEIKALQDDSLLIYIGQWIERWCNDHGAKIEDVQRALEIQSQQLHFAISKIDNLTNENRAAHQETQALIKPVRYFIEFEGYLRPFLDQSRLFRHDWTLVGRGEAVQALSDFIRFGAERIGIVSGRGGIGKSKLLVAAIYHSKNMGWAGRVYFVPEHVPLREISEAELPSAGSLIIIDDAHRYEDLAALLEVLNLHSPDVRILLATRPHALEYLKSTVVGAKYDLTQVHLFPSLENISKADIKLLAEQALGPDFKYLSEQIVDSTWDSPLVTVIAGQLVAREALSPALLERKAEFRDSVLGRFRDEMLGKVDSRIPTSDCVSMLEVLSAVAPASTANQHFIKLVANFNAISEDRVRRTLAAMEASGLLIRRGLTVRIAPDVLADYVLNNVCVQNGAVTGYAERVFSTFFETCPEQVLRNLAELDWRIRHDNAADVNILSQIWATLEQDYKTSNFDRQVTILKVLKGIAYLQPQHVLPLVEHSIRENASEISAVPERKDLWRITGGDVIRQIPSVLREIGYRLDYLPYCCDLLWRLGRDDSRSLNAAMNHPVRILQDIASYQQYKLLKPHQIILERALAWWDEPDAETHLHTPIEVLKKLLEKDGHSSVSRGHAIQYSPFLVDVTATGPIRQQVISRLKVATRGTNLRVANEALTLLGNFLLPPHPPFGLPVTEADADQWLPEQRDVFTHMTELFTSTTEPVRRLQIAAAIPLYIRRRKVGIDHALLLPIFSALANDSDLRRLRSIMQFGGINIEDENDDQPNNWQARADRRNAEIGRVARELIDSDPSASTANIRLVEDVRRMRNAGISVETWQLFQAIAQADEGFGMRLARIIWADPQSPLLGRSDIFLAFHRAVNQDGAGAILLELVTSNAVELRRLAAQYVSTSGCLHIPIAAEIEAIDQLLADGDCVVNGIALGGLCGLRSSDARGAIDRALDVDLGSSPDVARKICEVLMKDYITIHDAVTDEDLTRLLCKLVSTASIEDYHIAQCIKEMSKRVPEAVVDLAISRIKHAQTDLSYHALPHGAEIFAVEVLAEHPSYPKLLCRVRDEMFEPTASSFGISKLYSYLSGHFTQPISIRVLTDDIETRTNAQLLVVSAIFREAGSWFVFKEREVVGRMLDRAINLGDECYASVKSDLYWSAMGGERHGVAGQPFPQDTSLRDRAVEMLKGCTTGSRLHDFYEIIRKDASDNIKAALSEVENDE